MENIVNFDYYEDTTSQVSSDESYYSVSSSPALPSYEEFDNYDYSTDTSSTSIYPGNFEQALGQIIPTVNPAPIKWIEVLGIFPTEVRGTTFYQPLFYYVPIYSNTYCPLSPDIASEQYETESTEYCSTDSDADFSSSSSDTYYTAEESELYFDPDEYDCEAFDYLNDTNLEKTNFECSTNEEFELSGDKECLESECLERNYEEKEFDNVEQQNKVNFKTRKSDYLANYKLYKDNDHCRSEYPASICDEKYYNDTLPNADNTFEKKESKGVGGFNSESCNDIECFSSGNLLRSCDDNDFENITSLSKYSMIENLEKTFRTKLVSDKREKNEVMISPYVVSNSSDDKIKNNKVDKHCSCSIREISEGRDFSEKCSTNIFEFGDVKNKNCQPGQYLKKPDSLENLSRFEDNEMCEKDFQCDNLEMGVDSYECEIESLSFDPDDFEFTEEEVKHMKDQIYLRALSGKLYQKTHIPSVAVLPTIYEENECCGKMDEQQVVSHGSCLTEQGHLDDSLCNLYETSSENGEASEKSQQKPKKKKMERIREYLARIFCCVKPP